MSTTTYRPKSTIPTRGIIVILVGVIALAAACTLSWLLWQQWQAAIESGKMTTPKNLVWYQAPETWAAGGWAMPAIAVIAVIMFGMGVHVFVALWEKAYQFIFVGERTWRHWINHPSERRGEIGEVLDFVTGGSNLEDTAAFFDDLRSTEVDPFQRKLRVMKVCVGAAPLLGLLGTVTGMLTTFGALSSSAGGEKTMSMIAAGISEALYTTATGLSIALPGLVFQQMLAQMYEWYKTAIAHLETVCTQDAFRKLHHQTQDD